MGTRTRGPGAGGPGVGKPTQVEINRKVAGEQFARYFYCRYVIVLDRSQKISLRAPSLAFSLSLCSRRQRDNETDRAPLASRNSHAIFPEETDF